MPLLKTNSLATADIKLVHLLLVDGQNHGVVQAFSRGPRGRQAHPDQGVVKYHTLQLPDPNSSVNFSDEPDELG